MDEIPAPIDSSVASTETGFHFFGGVSMLELIAQGPSQDSRWRRMLSTETVELGRETKIFRTPWDSQISRRHVRLTVVDRKLHVEKIKDASNPVFFDGEPKTSFHVAAGEHFVIGKTTFTVAADRAFVSLQVPDPISQKTFSPEFLKKVVYLDADRRIDVLNGLPEIISSAGNIDELLIQMVNTLMAGINTASTIGFVQIDPSTAESNAPAESQLTENSLEESQRAIDIIHWDRRGFDEGDFQPSESLIRRAIESGETILHIWNQDNRESRETKSTAAYTFDYENDWAFACPISSDASPGWGIYVAGTNRSTGSTGNNPTHEPDLQGDIKFCELVGSTLKNLLMVKQLERQQASLGTFFSPIVMEMLSGQDPDQVLAPRKCDVTVLFCDLRGFSKTSEQMANQLLELLASVSDSLGIMTRRILEHGGVIGDFQGDSAMGFWGWPLMGTDQNENAAQAISAALKIRDGFDNTLSNDPNFQNFQIGLGLASGAAVAGKIGSQDQVKVTVFGPVVNLASRLEGMTRWVNTGILTESETVNRLRNSTLSESMPTTFRIGTFQPFGMTSSLDVFQVTPQSEFSEDSISKFENGLESFESGNWSQATDILQPLSGENGAAEFITNFMNDHLGKPPSDWEGVIRMKAK